MRTKNVEIGKPPHNAAQMKLSHTVDGDFAAVCPTCEGYVLLTEEQAGAGGARCFGNVVLVTWDEQAQRGFIK